MKSYRIIIPLIAALLISGCAVFRPARELEITPAEKATEVRDLLSVLKTQNEALRNFKGIGNIQIRQDSRLQLDQRVAWIGEKPVKLSIAVLISGYPAVKLANDGKWLYYLEVHGQDTTFRKIPASDPSLKKLISIPISSSEVITLLSGQIPRSGALKYRAEIKNRQSINGFQVPLQLRLLTHDGADCLLMIDRYWVNVDPPPSVFVLAPPN